MLPLNKKDPVTWLYALLGGFVVVRFICGVIDPYLDADEAVFGLMAKHFAEGRELPVFYWGQNYLGVILCYPMAFLFWIFGASVHALHAATGLFWLLSIVGVFWLVRQSKASPLFVWLGTALFITAPFFMTVWAFAARGYIECFAGTVWMVALFFKARESDYQVSWRALVLFGALLGLLFWNNALYLPVFAACVVCWTIDQRRHKRWKDLLWISPGALIGAFPVISFTLRHGNAHFAQIFEDGRPVGQKISEALDRFPRLFSQGLPHLFGVRDPYTDQWIWPHFGWLVLAVVFGAIGTALFCKKHRAMSLTLALAALGVVFAQLWSKYGWFMDEGRYMIMLWIAMPVFFAHFFEAMWEKARWTRVVMALSLATMLFCHTRAFVPWIRPAPLREVVAFLAKEQLRAAYTDYWDSYPITFYSKEWVVASSKYGPGSQSRYAPYDFQVQLQSRVAFVLGAHPKFQGLKDRLRELDPAVRIERIGSYEVFHGFTTDIRAQLGR